MRTVRFKGNPMVLAGRVLKEGDIAPDFRVVSQDLKEISLSDFSGKIKVITFFPSIDTPVCDLQVKEFNKRASGFSPEVAVIGISKDLPFAQKRFCQAGGITKVSLLSDYKYSSFGINYGFLIKELNLLARGIIILDRNNRVRYIQVVEELTSPPDYDIALKALEETLKNPVSGSGEGVPVKCKPCEGGVPPLPQIEIDKLIMQCSGWQLIEGRKITKEIKFKDFSEAKYFLDLLSVIVEEQGHHPALTLTYNKLKITFTTHAAGGLTENDFIMAGIVDAMEA